MDRRFEVMFSFYKSKSVRHTYIQSCRSAEVSENDKMLGGAELLER